MWLTIGFVALVCFSAIMIYHRYTAEWRGTTAEHNGIPYEFRVYKGSDSRQIKVGFRTSRRYDFVIRRHSGIDNALEHIGLSSDKVICNQSFDSSLLILSDDFLASQVLAGVPGLADDVLRIFELGDENSARIEKLVCRRGRLWALVDDKSADPALMSDMADVAVPVLNEFAGAMVRFQGLFGDQRTDRYAVPAVAMLLLATGFFTKGIMEWVAAGMPVIPNDILMHAVLFGAMASVAVAVVILRFMRDGLRNHKLFAELFFVSMLGAFGTIYADRMQSHDMEMVRVSGQEYPVVSVEYEG